MKKHFLFAAVAALVTCACSVEPVDIVDVQPEEEGEFTVLTAGFAGDEDGTRTVRQDDGKVFWLPGDQISVVRGTRNAKFTGSNTGPAASATFSGTMPSGSGNYWAVYPYDVNNNIQNGYLVTTLPNQQKAVAGSFADDLFISAAYVSSTTTSLTFHHQCGGIKFTVTEPGIKRVTLIPADESVFLAGLIGLYAGAAGSTPYIRATGYPEDMFNTIELSAPEGKTLEVGEAYHFVTMPATLTGGFSLFFEREDGKTATRFIDKNARIQAGHFLSLKNVDQGLTWRSPYLTYSPDEVTLDGMGGVFGIDVTGTMEYHFDVSSTAWLREVSTSGDARFGRRHAFMAERNDGEERTGLISICYGTNCFPILVTQGSSAGMKAITHHSLGMRFTATWCGWCPYMNESFTKAKDLLGDRFDYVNLHAYDSELAFGGTTTLSNLYQISGYPTGIIDGRNEIENSTNTDSVAQTIASAVDQQESYYPAQTAVGLNSSLDGRKLTVQADVFARYPGTYKLTVFLLESGVVNYQNGGGNNYVHNKIARMSLTDYRGDAVEITEENGKKTVEYPVTVPDTYVLGNMTVLAYVQRSFGDLPVIQSGNYGEWFVDNCRSAELGATAALEVR